MRRQVISGNWKMYKTSTETKKFFEDNLNNMNSNDKDVVFYTSFVTLKDALEAVKGTKIVIGAQNMHYETEGAYTGEISGEMLKEVGISNVLLGHSERRKYYNETDESVNFKLKKALLLSFNVTVCVGEDLSEREAGLTFDVIKRQIVGAFKDIPASELQNIVIAYEPVWAIGTGKTASNEQAEEACAKIRCFISELYGNEVADQIRILYGGSVKPSNIKDLMALENIDGVLVGGASLTADFEQIIHFDK